MALWASVSHGAIGPDGCRHPAASQPLETTMPESPKAPREVPAAVIARLKQIAGPQGYLDKPEDIRPYCIAWRDSWEGRTPIVMRPRTTAELSEIVRICAEN